MALVSVTAYAENVWISSDAYGDLQVVVSDRASESEKFAATEFQKYWRETTGHDIGISNRAEPGKTHVSIGREGAELVEQDDLDGLGDDGYLIRTVQPESMPAIDALQEDAGRTVSADSYSLVIVGGQKRGTLYGVHEFFKNYLGVRWLTPEFTHVPQAPSSLPRIDFRYVPPFMYRDISYRAFMQDAHYAVFHKVNGHSVSAIPERMGGNIRFVGAGGGHTFFDCVSPKEYGETHPEYFSEINGERVAEQIGSQLCLSNPDVLRLTIDGVRQYLRNSPPEFRLVSVAQMDFWGWCTCEKCKAIDDREGSPAGSIITFVNKVAAAIEEEFPEAYIHTFAYLYSRKPPKHVKPRDNVIVQLCSIECDFSRPLSDAKSPLNRAFQKDIKVWNKITKNLFIYDYTQNWWCFQQPHPNFHVFQPNAKFFAENGAIGVYEQSSPFSPHSDYEYLKGYIVSESLWDPDVDWRELYDEFVDLYYGKAAPFIREYHQLITDKVHKENYVLEIFSRMEWMDYETVVKAQELFAEAFNAVRGDETATTRLDSAYLPVQYAALFCPPRVRQTSDAYILTRPPSQAFDEYWDMIRGYGVTFLADQLIFDLKDRAEGETPPRYERLDIEKIENENYEVWIVPAKKGSIVRFKAKSTSQDLLAGYKDIAGASGMWQDWSIADPDAEEPVGETCIAEKFEVISRTSSSVTIQCRTENELLVTRRMSLKPGSDVFEVTLEIKNAGDEPVVPRIKIHPEFWTHGEAMPRIWIERDGAWEKVKMAMLPDGGAGGGSIEPDGVTAWAYRIPKRPLTLINAIESDEVDSLFYFYHRTNQHVNLELIPVQTPLAPGETRMLHSTYAVTQKRPGKS